MGVGGIVAVGIAGLAAAFPQSAEGFFAAHGQFIKKYGGFRSEEQIDAVAAFAGQYAVLGQGRQRGHKILLNNGRGQRGRRYGTLAGHWRGDKRLL